MSTSILHKGAFHPVVAQWFASAFAAPTNAQAEAWPAIAAGGNVLIAAPTGSGKTLAAFLSSIDKLLRQGPMADQPFSAMGPAAE
jgi:ATP-dependent Lhr-like helicase